MFQVTVWRGLEKMKLNELGKQKLGKFPGSKWSRQNYVHHTAPLSVFYSGILRNVSMCHVSMYWCCHVWPLLNFMVLYNCFHGGITHKIRRLAHVIAQGNSLFLLFFWPGPQEMNCVCDCFQFPHHSGSQILSLRVDKYALYFWVSRQWYIWLPGIVHMRADLNACDCTLQLYKHRRVCSGSWLQEKNPIMWESNLNQLNHMLGNMVSACGHQWYNYNVFTTISNYCNSRWYLCTWESPYVLHRI